MRFFILNFVLLSGIFRETEGSSRKNKSKIRGGITQASASVVNTQVDTASAPLVSNELLSTIPAPTVTVQISDELVTWASTVTSVVPLEEQAMSVIEMSQTDAPLFVLEEQPMGVIAMSSADTPFFGLEKQPTSVTAMSSADTPFFGLEEQPTNVAVTSELEEVSLRSPNADIDGDGALFVNGGLDGFLSQQHFPAGTDHSPGEVAIEFDDENLIDLGGLNMQEYSEEEETGRNLSRLANNFVVSTNDLLVSTRPHQIKLVRLSAQGLARLQEAMASVDTQRQLEILTNQAGHIYVHASDFCAFTKASIDNIPWADVQLAVIKSAVSTAQGTAFVISSVSRASSVATCATVKFVGDVATSPITRGIIQGIGTGIVYAELGVVAGLQLMLNVAKPVVDNAADSLRSHLYRQRQTVLDEQVGTVHISAKKSIEDDGDDF